MPPLSKTAREGKFPRGARIAGKAKPLARSGGGRFIRRSHPCEDGLRRMQANPSEPSDGTERPAVLSRAAGAIHAAPPKAADDLQFLEGIITASRNGIQLLEALCRCGRIKRRSRQRPGLLGQSA